MVVQKQPCGMKFIVTDWNVEEIVISDDYAERISEFVTLDKKIIDEICDYAWEMPIEEINEYLGADYTEDD